jgi:hypothetical protein
MLNIMEVKKNTGIKQARPVLNTNTNTKTGIKQARPGAVLPQKTLHQLYDITSYFLFRTTP